MRQVQLEDGVWYRCGEAYQHVCCDCGLTHDVEFMMSDGKLFYRWTRNPASTAEERAETEYLCKPRRKAVRKPKA